MRGTSIFALVFGFSVATVACSSSSKSTPLVALDAQAFCNKDVTTCGDTSTGTVDECQANAALLRVTQSCAALINGATCDDLLNPTSSFANTCFPPCKTPGNTCDVDGKTITDCEGDSSDGGTSTSRSIIIDCAAGCQSQSLTYTGTCGTSFDGQTSDTPQCWCD
jgi:hypothetical protein